MTYNVFGGTLNPAQFLLPSKDVKTFFMFFKILVTFLTFLILFSNFFYT